MFMAISERGIFTVSLTKHPLKSLSVLVRECVTKVHLTTANAFSLANVIMTLNLLLAEREKKSKLF